MKLFAHLLESYWSEGHRLHPKEIVEDYEHTIYDELDLQKEAANGSQLRRNFENSEILYVPKVYWRLHTHQRHGHGANFGHSRCRSE